MTKVLITRGKLDGLVDAYNTATGGSGAMTLDQLKNGIAGIVSPDLIIAGGPTDYSVVTNATEITQYKFYGDLHLKTISGQKVKTIGSSTFESAKGLTSIDFPAAETISQKSFSGCRGITGDVVLPSVKTLGTSAFNDCRFIDSIQLGSGETGPASIPASCFSYCNYLKTCDIYGNSLKEIGSNAFYGAIGLERLIIRRTDGIVTLTSTLSLANTKIYNKKGYIYVPDDLVESYKTATNWSTFTEVIKGLSELE